MPVIMRDEMTGPMARQRVNIITHKQVSGYGLGQPRGWGFNALGFTSCKHYIHITNKRTRISPT
jgi:hypothetical protein